MGNIDKALTKQEKDSLRRKGHLQNGEIWKKRKQDKVMAKLSSHPYQKVKGRIDNEVNDLVAEESTPVFSPEKFFNPKCVRHGSLIITNDKLAFSLHMAKLSDHNVALVLIPVIQQLVLIPAI